MRIGSPPAPSPASECVSPWFQVGGEGEHPLAGEGARGEPIRTTKEKAWHSRYRMIHKVLTHVEYRAVSGVFQNIDPPPPLRECVLPLHQRRGATLSLGGERVEGQYFGRRQTLDWPLTVQSLHGMIPLHLKIPRPPPPPASPFPRIMEEGLIRMTKTSPLYILGLLFSVGLRLELENVTRHTFPHFAPVATLGGGNFM